MKKLTVLFIWLILFQLSAISQDKPFHNYEIKSQQLKEIYSQHPGITQAKLRELIRESYLQEKSVENLKSFYTLKKKAKGKKTKLNKHTQSTTDVLPIINSSTDNTTLLAIQSATVFNQVPDSMEFKALKALFENTGGGFWINKEGWPYTSWPEAGNVTWEDLNDWYGITVEQGDVVMLELSSNNLHGNLPEELGMLSSLQSINIEHNKLTSLPPSIGNLSNLIMLYLEDNELPSIPASIGNLSQLMIIDLFGNNLSSIPNEIGQLSTLKNLYLSENNLNSLPESIGQLTNLEILNASANNLTEIPASLGQLSALQHLSLKNNKLTSLPTEIGGLIDLMSITLNGNQLSEIPIEFGQLQRLFSLDLSDNNFTNFPDAITQLAGLNELRMDNNRISSLPSNMGDLYNLMALTLSNNDFSEFPTEILDIFFLMELHLNGNDISTVPEEIDLLSELTFLYIADNHIVRLPAALGSLPWFWGLNISGNDFEGFPNEVLAYKELMELYVENLELDSIPASIADSLIYLSDLYVSGNDLDFADLEIFFTGPGETLFANFSYAPQNDIEIDTTLLIYEGQPLEFTFSVGGDNNTYIWKKLNDQGEWIPVDTTDNLSAFAASKEDDGTYQVEVSNPIVTGLRIRTGGNGIAVDVYYHNYVLEEDILIRGVTENQMIDALTMGEKAAHWTYFDGLQRELQSVAQWQSPNGNDMVQPVDYDELLRQKFSFMPYTTANLPTSTPGQFHPKALSGEQEDFYSIPPPGVPQEGYYSYSETVFESSLLSRPLEQSAPGESWSLGNGHTSSQSYLANDANEVLYWKISGDSVIAEGYYNAKELNKLLSIGSQGSQNVSYTDKMGRNILIKSQLNDTSWVETYPVYDQFGNAVYQLTPQAVAQSLDKGSLPYSVSKEALDLWCFQSVYDNQGRLIEQKTPGIEPVYFVYDRWDRLVLSQDGNKRKQDQWSFTKYDQLNTPIISGLCTDARPVEEIREALQNLTDDQRYEYPDDEGDHGYSARTFPSSGIDKVLLVSYYDNYDFLTDLDSVYRYDPNELEGLPETAFDLTEGLITASKINILGTDEYLWTVNWYDANLRTIQVAGSNHLGGVDKISNIYNFIGLLMQSKTNHTTDRQNIISIIRRVEYDHVGRPLRSYHKINDQEEVLLSEFRYNELGQLIEKNLHKTSESFLQSVDYKYNIQGWLMAINSADNSLSDDGDFFGMELVYDQLLNGISNTPQYNGNISAALWNGSLDSLSGKAYSYGYDQGSRLLNAQHYQKDPAWNSVSAYSVPAIEYDRNGNIKNLNRKDASGDDLDDLTYEYEGNQLKAVTDAGDSTKGFKDGNKIGEDYGYDANGNLAFDKNLGIDSIYYYSDNHPDSIVFGNSLAIKYIYDAAGIKLGQRIYNQDTLLSYSDYSGEFIYQNGRIQLIKHEEGRLVPKAAGGFVYEYHLTDHLGNIRVTFTSEPETEVMIATVEMQNADAEEIEFLRLSDTRTSTIQAIDHTGDSEYPKVSRLNGSKGIMEGPGKLIRVMPGDKVKMEVYAKYLDMRKADSRITAAALLSALTQSGTATIPGDPVQTVINNSTIPVEALAALGGKDMETPKAYLNYYLFDNNFNQLDAGFVRVSDDAAITTENINSEHEKLTLEVEVTEPGYLFTNLSHDEAENVDVYFDDYTVIHEHGYVLQVQDYYPFGLTFEEKIRDHSVLNKYLFQGKERLDSLDWDDFAARMYNPALGRFLGVDPQRQFSSPYLGMGNTPINGIDPNGEWFGVDDLIAAAIGGVINLTVNAIQGNLKGDNIWQSIGKGFAAFGSGAAAGTLSLYGPAGWAAGGAIVGSTNSWLGGATGWDIVAGAGIGAVSGLAGGAAGTYLNGALSQTMNPILRNAIIGGGAGLAGGFTGGFGAGMYYSGGNFGQGLKHGAIGGGTGLILGGTIGGIVGYFSRSPGGGSTNRRNDEGFIRIKPNGDTPGGIIRIEKPIFDPAQIQGEWDLTYSPNSAKFNGQSVTLTGQTHHLLSTRIIRALNQHSTLRGVFSRNDPRFIYKAVNKPAHSGYQQWHRQYDATVVGWLRDPVNAYATPAQFRAYLHTLHQQPWLQQRIPGVNLNW